MNNIETMKQWLEALDDRSSLMKWQKAREALRQAIEQAQQAEPVALKKGECWPEDVMQMWDNYRKEIANGHTGSEPRDWFESLAEMRLVDTSPPPLQPLTDEEIIEATKPKNVWEQDDYIQVARAIEAAHNIKEKA